MHSQVLWITNICPLKLLNRKQSTATANYYPSILETAYPDQGHKCHINLWYGRYCMKYSKGMCLWKTYSYYSSIQILYTVCLYKYIIYAGLMVFCYFNPKARETICASSILCARDTVCYRMVYTQHVCVAYSLFLFFHPPPPQMHKPTNPPLWILELGLCVCVPLLHYKDSCLFSVAFFFYS